MVSEAYYLVTINKCSWMSRMSPNCKKSSSNVIVVSETDLIMVNVSPNEDT